MVINDQNSIKLLNDALTELKKLYKKRLNSPEHIEFIQSTGILLNRIFGLNNIFSYNFIQIRYQPSSYMIPIVDPFRSIEMNKQDSISFINGLQKAEGILKSAIYQVKNFGLKETIQFCSAQKDKKCNIFISHGHRHDVLQKIEKYIESLGLSPIIVKDMASSSKSLDDLIEDRINESEVVIILATGDDKTEKGDIQPRQNIIHEIGVCQAKQKKIIYLLEEGCSFPTDIKPKVYETFKPDNLENIYLKINKELKEWGII